MAQPGDICGSSERLISSLCYSSGLLVKLEAHRRLRTPLSLMFSYCSKASSDQGPQFGDLLLKKATTELTIVAFASFMQAAEYAVAGLFTPACLPALSENGHLLLTKESWYCFRAK